MKCGVYVGPVGQLIEVYIHIDEGNSWHRNKAARVFDTQSFWIENGSMTEEVLYLINGWEYLGEI